jgi:protein-S-isoprenylcysteine O-methyltransferase Ste14
LLVFWIGLTVLIILAGWTLWRVQRDYQVHKDLTSATVTAVWLLYFLHFAVELYAAWNRYLPFNVVEPLAIVIGLLLVLAGMVIYVVGILHLRSIRRMSGLDTSRLVTTGIYQWSRNPQNVGWALVLIGIGLISRSGLAIIMALLFCGLFRLYIPIEEQYLESVYGDKYREYKMSSHRYFGPSKA